MDTKVVESSLLWGSESFLCAISFQTSLHLPMSAKTYSIPPGIGGGFFAYSQQHNVMQTVLGSVLRRQLLVGITRRP